MVWLVTVWKQKHHMSKLYLVPAVPHVIDKANELKFRTNMGSPYHSICIATVGAPSWRDIWATRAD